MASSISAVNASAKNCVIKTLVVEFDSTDATVEVATGMTKIYGVYFGRIGAVDASDAGLPSVSETVTSGVLTVDADGDITVVRQPVLAAGTLVSEKFFCTIVGY